MVLFGLIGCHPVLKRKAEGPEQALRQIRFFYPTFEDDLSPQSLILALNRNAEYLNRLNPEKEFRYGPHRFTCRQVLKGQEVLLELLVRGATQRQVNRLIRKHFRVYRAAGRPGDGKVLFTGYYEPVYEASLTRNAVYAYPLYRKPEDLLRIDLTPFGSRFKGRRITARIEGNQVLPYYSRYDIEVKQKLAGRNLEIAYLKDPVDVAFLHIQGSGRLKMPDGSSLLVGYHAANGRPYRSIGRYMIEQGYMTRDQMSMQGIRRYLTQHPEVVDQVLNHNPSYVFFRVLDKGPLGSLGVSVTPGRTLALDYRLFPRGALAYITCRKPVLDETGHIVKWKRFSRFVLNQDTGGAIRGAGRADLFWGSGAYAETAAGHLKHEGRLYILIHRP
jgi:membrane-bound lytic murein transglycosylase A